MSGLPQERQINLQHYSQRYSWDCGLSCIIMIISATQRQQFLENFQAICAEEGFTTSNSTWTIDLCYILQRFQIKHEYYTKTLGIDPNYAEHSYYTNIIKIDEQRINQKFHDALSRGLHVKKMTLSIEQILWHLAKYGPVILLTNASLLKCEICKIGISKRFAYAGHYVVLCGYNMKTKGFFYHNPEVKDGHVCRCSMESMDVARKAYGTDEDAILIFEN